MCYESLNVQNRMCELCTFSQIWSHMCIAIHAKNYLIIFIVVPDPVVTVFAPSIQTVSNPLTLECNVSTVRGITSSMDTVWSSNGLELKRSEGMKSNVIKNDSVMYMDSYTIPQLGTVDEGRTYQCGIIINQILPITVNDSITLDVTGEPYACIITCSVHIICFTC